MSTRFPLQVESSDSLGPEPSPESASMAGAEKSGQSSESHDQGAEPSPGDQGSASTNGLWAVGQQNRGHKVRDQEVLLLQATAHLEADDLYVEQNRGHEVKIRSAKSSAVDSDAEDDLSSDVPYRRATTM